MKGCISTLLLAFLAAIIAAFIGRSCHQEGVETALNQRVAEQIQQEYPGISVKYDHFTAVVTGVASADQVGEIRDRIDELSGDNGRIHFAVTDPSGRPLLPDGPKDPWNLTIQRSGDKLLLDGIVNSEQTKDILNANAEKVSGVTVDNQLKISEDTRALSVVGAAVDSIPALMNAASDARLVATAKQVTISGLVDDSGTKKRLLSLFTPDVWQGAKIVDQLTVKPKPVAPTPDPVPDPEPDPEPEKPKRDQPSSLSLLRKGDTLTLSGIVDTPATKNQIAKSAEAPGLTVVNNIEVSETHLAPTHLAPAVAAIPALMSASQNGQLDISPKRVVVNGEVKDQPAKTKLMGFFAADKWPGTEIVDQVKVLPPPRTIEPKFSLSKNAQKQLILTGLVDTPATKNQIAKLAAVDGLDVVNQLKVGPRVKKPAKVAAALSGVSDLFGATDTGRLEVGSDKLVLKGMVKDQATKDGILGRYPADQWPNVAIVDQIGLLPAPKPMTIERDQAPTFTLTKKANALSAAGKLASPEAVKLLTDAIGKVQGLKLDNQVEVSAKHKELPSPEPVSLGVPALLAATDDGQVIVKGKKITVAGLVKDNATKQSILKNFGGWQGYSIVDQIEVKPAPKAKPSFSWTEQSPTKTVLTGKVPTEAIKISLVDAAKRRLRNDVEVVDRIEVSDEVTDAAWLKALPKFTADNLGLIKKTKVSINERASSISGLVKDIDTMQNVSVAFSGINPPGKLDFDLKIPKPDPTLPPAVALSGKADKLALTGNVPDKATHDAIVGSILAIKGIDKLEDKLKINSSVKSDAYLEALPTFVGEFYKGSVAEREFSLQKQEITLKGVVPSEQAKADTLALTTPFSSKGVKVIDQLRIVKPAEPAPVPPPAPPVAPEPIKPNEGDLYSIYFGTGESHIQPSEAANVKMLLAKAKAATGKIVIDGFADERGTAALNDTLSDARAKRIRSYLVENGIDEDRIVSVIGRGAITGDSNQYDKFRRTDVRIVAD